MKTVGMLINKILRIFGLKLILLKKIKKIKLPFKFRKNSNYSLILIGGHNGSKTIEIVKSALDYGKVCIVEPIPYLFDELSRLYRENPKVNLVNAAITINESEYVDFYAPTREANKILNFGDQLGSLISDHATNVDLKFKPHIKKIKVKALKISKLIQQIDCKNLDLLMLDTEGFDAQLIKNFPFENLRPDKIIFEHKHSDGTNRIGNKLANVITLLDSLNYSIRIMDDENVYAKKKSL